MIEEDEPKYVYLDRPFMYAIVDTQTGMPVFIGTVNTCFISRMDDSKPEKSGSKPKLIHLDSQPQEKEYVLRPFAIGIACFAILVAFMFIKIGRIEKSEALKNVE